jgi:uncharacterized phiE125 gp8 family phage protein
MLDIVVPPAGSGLTLAELKSHLRVEPDQTADDADIAALAEVALAMIETDLHRAYALRTLEWVLPAWRPCLRLPIAPAVSVESVTYTDLSGAVRVLEPASYVVEVSGRSRAIVLRWGWCWPLLGQGERPIVVRYQAGGVPLPPPVRHAAKLLVGHLYDNREAVVGNAANVGELPLGVEALISAERWS